MIDIIRLDSCDSTNTYLSGICRDLVRDTVVITREQTAGKGQRGNSWESAPGMNLTCSLLLNNTRGISAREQFVISEAVSLGIVDTLRRFIPANCPIKVKWPNDIYAGDKKICGILIEHSISGRDIARSIIGIGINVNQHDFLSDAPNPVSVYNIIGREIAVDDVLAVMLERIYIRLDEPAEKIHSDYKCEMWRRDSNRYREVASGDEFFAKIVDVHPDGTLCLLDESSAEHRYLFKEVAVVLPV